MTNAARADLAYCDQAVEKAIRQHANDPGSVPQVAAEAEQAARTRIVGLCVVDGNARHQVHSQHVSRLRQYQEDAEELRRQLDAAGVEYLTIWPTKAWDQLCSEAGLFRFWPNDQGLVRFSGSIIAGIRSRAERDVRRRPLIGLATGGVVSAFSVGFVAVVLLAAPLWISAAGALVGGLFGALAGGAVADRLYIVRRDADAEPHPKRLARREQRLVRKLARLDQGKLVRALWPDRREPIAEDAGGRVSIELPDPPQEAQENLVRARDAGMELTLDVVPEAIGFPESPAAGLQKVMHRRWRQLADEADVVAAERRHARAERVRQWREALQDPIVTTSHGTATAVIVQFGDFPVEQEVVDTVLNSTAIV